MMPVKVDRWIYPPQGKTAGRMNALLAPIPGRDANKVRRTGIFRLIEQERSR